MLEKFGLPYRTHHVGLYAGTLADDLAALAPARTVPVLRRADGNLLTDTMAMGETLAEQHPDAGLWSPNPAAFALARSVVAEMHAGFTALRADRPMYLRHRWQGFQPTDAVQRDVARAENAVVACAHTLRGDGPVAVQRLHSGRRIFAPLAARIATYGLNMDTASQSYVDAHLADPVFRQWRACGQEKSYDPMPHAQNLPTRPWTGPE